MGYLIRSRDDHLRNDGSPKRILALDGGGLRGILSLGFLGRIEEVLRRRHGDQADFRLSHYFDLVAGTSTGAIIAGAIALGWNVDQIVESYRELGRSVFERSLLRQGLVRAKYDAAKLSRELQRAYGLETRLGGPELQTGLLVVTKRIDTGSPWPLSNNPNGKYFDRREDDVVPNRDYPLWQVVRASTAAPTFFEPEPIVIAEQGGETTQLGRFVDGGVSPFNNPALQALLYATLEGYRIGWPTGADRLLLVSVGTGTPDPGISGSGLSAIDGIRALTSLMTDCAALQDLLLQWMSESPTARNIDGEVGTLANDVIAPGGLVEYLRYNVDLRLESIRALARDVDDEQLEKLSEMDAPENLELLRTLGLRSAEGQVQEEHFPPRFDLS